MGFIRFADLNPTWDIIKFDEGLRDIPCENIIQHDRHGIRNPLDRRVALLFTPERGTYVYFLPKTGKVIVTGHFMLGQEELSEAFKTKVLDYKEAREKQRMVQSFICETVIGKSFVFRLFEITAECKKIENNKYLCSISPAKEVKRYAFCDGFIFKEDRDHIRTVTSIDKITCDNAYDTLCDADVSSIDLLYKEFINNVNINNKKEILRALSYVKKDYPKLGFYAFTEIYKKALDKDNIPKQTPDRIIRELKVRNHTPNTYVRIEKDLVVLIGERKCTYLNSTEQTRVYFDEKRAYYFIQNAVTGNWEAEDILSLLTFNSNIRYKNIDKDAFDNTCMEKYAAFSVNDIIPTGNKINLGYLLAQAFYLSAEQAAKIDKNVFDVILQNIYEGNLTDCKKSLSDLLGITGAQIKFLKDISIPKNITKFAECIDSDDFKEHFPDIKKRIFAVSFYLNGISAWGGAKDLTREEIFSASKTLNSLEKRNDKKKDELLSEYRDYLKMQRTYKSYVSNMRDDDPLREAITDLGEIPVNIKPSKIKDYHNKLIKVVDIISSFDEITKYTAIIKDRHDKEAKNTEYTNGTYSILMPKDANDIIQEGQKLHHCVGHAGYIEAMAYGLCTILFLRDNKELTKPLLTIEIRDKSIRQCFGIFDSYNHNPKIRDFIMDYAALQNYKIEATIYS